MSGGARAGNRGSIHSGARARTFDVICLGAASVRMTRSARLRIGSGAVAAARALARMGAAVGVASALGDDALGRRTRESLEESGVDTSGVALRPPSSGVFIVEGRGGMRDVVSTREPEDVAITIPSGWSSQVILLSGLSPVVAAGAALCKAARAARRWGATVVVDVDARARAWVGHDARAARSVLREADVVRCTMDDLVVLRVDAATMREMMRPNAVFVLGETSVDARASGPFGEIGPRPNARASADENGGALVARICFELAKGAEHASSTAALWERALRGR
jgi:sugar/nucleoside kinase (ribokinase family)